jgi:thymidylate synthase (FAD)
MKIELIHNTPLWVCAKAIRKCWASEDKSDTPLCTLTDGQGRLTECGEKDKELIHRVGNKNKHKSTLEHLVYTFDVDGISRACLQELARHRIASYSVKSTRYTLKELKEEKPFQVWTGNENGTTREEEIERVKKYCVLHPNGFVDDYEQLGNSLSYLSEQLKDGRPNDRVKYMLPEAYKTSLVWTINARSLQNFLELRSSKAALWEIREMAQNVFDALPEEHRYLFEEFIND